MNKQTINKVVTIIALAGMFCATSVFATPIVTNWSYIIDSGFTTWKDSANNTGTPSSNPTGITISNLNTLLNDPSKLSWGTGNNGQSSLSVGSASGGHVQGNLLTDAPAVNTVQVIHNNQPITGTTLTSAVLFDQIVLNETAPGTGTVTPNQSLNFLINYAETPNATPCVAPSPSGNPCNDIFVLDVQGAGFNPLNQSLNQNFFYNGNPYNAELFISGLNFLTAAECSTAGSSNSHCLGFTTVEGKENSFQVSLAITTEQFFPVPEPSILLLFGAGLCGMGWMNSRRQQA
jgi:PEP-CTERM motif